MIDPVELANRQFVRDYGWIVDAIIIGTLSFAIYLQFDPELMAYIRSIPLV